MGNVYLLGSFLYFYVYLTHLLFFLFPPCLVLRIEPKTSYALLRAILTDLKMLPFRHNGNRLTENPHEPFKVHEDLLDLTMCNLPIIPRLIIPIYN